MTDILCRQPHKCMSSADGPSSIFCNGFLTLTWQLSTALHHCSTHGVMNRDWVMYVKSCWRSAWDCNPCCQGAWWYVVCTTRGAAGPCSAAPLPPPQLFGYLGGGGGQGQGKE